MKVYILGIDGYIGWPLAQHLILSGHDVEGCDNFQRRHRAESLVPLDRSDIVTPYLDISDNEALIKDFDVFKPDTIIHLAEEPSAPYSMQSYHTAVDTQTNNIMGTISVVYAMRAACPDAHLIKLGSLGEYMPSSWYHLSKVHDTNNLKWASKTWGLTVTDIMQGPVYGVGGRFDYDDKWGTVINRFVAQAVVGEALTIYGSGNQVRGFLPIQDSLNCIEIVLNNSSDGYISIDQFAEIVTIQDIAIIVSRLTGCDMKNLDNPRIESIKAEQAADNKWLVEHGYEPKGNLYTNIQDLIDEITPFKDMIDISKFTPQVKW